MSPEGTLPTDGARPPPRLLRDALGQLRLDGAIFFRSELSEAFEFESSPLALADALRPGAQRLTLFHIVAQGSCWVAVADGERHWAREGDVIVQPYGDRYSMGGATPAEAVPILDLLDPLPWAELPVIRHGGGGARTDVVCGYMVSDDPLFDPVLRALPPVFVVRLPPGPGADWVRASIDYAVAEAAVPSDRNASLLSTRLPELVLIEVLREHLATAPAADHGWLAALRDPVVSPALTLIHGQPDRSWTVADLAAVHGGVALAARPGVPGGPRPLPHPLPDGVAHAPGGRPAGDDRHPGGGRGPARRLRLGGGVQPGVQAGPGPLAEPVA